MLKEEAQSPSRHNENNRGYLLKNNCPIPIDFIPPDISYEIPFQNVINAMIDYKELFQILCEKIIVYSFD